MYCGFLTFTIIVTISVNVNTFCYDFRNFVICSKIRGVLMSIINNPVIEKIEELLETSGKTHADLLRYLGIKRNPTFTEWKNGKLKSYTKYLPKIAEFFNVSVDYFYEKEQTLSLEHRLLIAAFDRLSPANKKMAFGLLNAIYDVQAEAEELNKPKTIQIKLSKNKVSAGKGYDLNNDNDFTKIPVLETEDSKSASFAVKVEGDSMTPTFDDKDIVLVERCDSVDIGEIGIFVVNGKGFIKERGNGCLISHNSSKHKPLILKESDEQKCWGKVIGKAVLVNG